MSADRPSNLRHQAAHVTVSGLSLLHMRSSEEGNLITRTKCPIIVWHRLVNTRPYGAVLNRPNRFGRGGSEIVGLKSSRRPCALSNPGVT
jgi:hypothetical protein